MSKNKINKLYGRALIVPETLNAENREVDVIFATETPVFRCGWNGDYNEVLSCKPDSIRQDRIKNGLPVIDSHETYSLKSQIGRTKNIKFSDNQGIATIVFSKRKEVEGIIQDIQDGIIKDISVGYRVHKFEDEGTPSGERIPTYRAVDWEPHEISFVTVPADPNCGVRKGSEEQNEVEVINKNTNNIKSRKIMIEVICPECGHEFEVEEAGSVTCPECDAEFTVSEERAEEEKQKEERKGKRSIANSKNEKTVDINAIREEATKSDKERLNAILLSSRAAKLTDTYAIELYKSDKTTEECRHEIIVKAAEGQKSIDASHGASVQKDAIDNKRSAITNVILNRVMPSHFELEKGNDFRGMRMVEMARELLNERGISTKGKTPNDIWMMSRAHSTSDFPLLFEDAMNKLLRADYEFAPEYWQNIARQTSVSDFRARNFYQVESENGMHETPEGGEIKYTTLKEAKQTIRVKKYAQGIKFTREAFINDDLNALSLIPNRFVKDWDELRGDLVWGMIIDNVKMDDGEKLFSTIHNNVLGGATSAFGEVGLEKALLAFKNQKALGGKRRIRVIPRTLLIPAELEISARKQLTAIQANTVKDVNVFNSMFEIIVEPRLTDPDAWYLQADPNAIDGLYYAYLDGNDGLRVNSEDDFNTDAMKYAVRGEFGVAAVDFRGIVKSLGK